MSSSIGYFDSSRNYRITIDDATIQHKIEKQNKIADLHKTDDSLAKSIGLEISYNYSSPQSFSYRNLLNRAEFFTIQNLPICDELSCSVEVAEFLGGRPSQEDNFVASSFKIITLANQTHTVLLTGVLDGHRGRAVADYVKENLPKKLENLFSSLFNKALKEEHPLKVLEDEQSLSDKVIWNVLKIACVELQDECTHPYAGTTAAFSLLIDGEDLWHVNVGDSRSIITSKEKTIQLSEDMRMRFNFAQGITKEAFDAIESDFKQTCESNPEIVILQKRIKRINSSTIKTDLKAALPGLQNKLDALLLNNEKMLHSNFYERSVWKRGGWVENEHRLNGDLAMPRAIGDRDLGSGLSPRPKITKISLSKEFSDSEFCTLLHGCDGLWDVATTIQVAEAINNDQSSVAQVSANLAFASTAAIDFSDNVSTVITRIDLRALRETRK
jgi:serine/threonine protein phosphatase PrpC